MTGTPLDDFATQLIRRKARSLAGRSGYLEADREDLEQSLAIDLLRRLPDHDPGRGKREVFVHRVIRNEVAHLAASRRKGVRDYRCEAGSLDHLPEALDGEDNECPPVLDSAEFLQAATAAAKRDEDRAGLRLDLGRAVSKLPPDLQALCQRLLTSSAAQIARERGVHRSTVYRAVRRLRAHFERNGLAAYLDGCDRNANAQVGTPGEPTSAARRGVR